MCSSPDSTLCGDLCITPLCGEVDQKVASVRPGAGRIKLDNWILEAFYLVMSTNLLPLVLFICIVSTVKQFLFGVSLLSVLHEMPLEVASGRQVVN